MPLKITKIAKAISRKQLQWPNLLTIRVWLTFNWVFLKQWKFCALKAGQNAKDLHQDKENGEDKIKYRCNQKRNQHKMELNHTQKHSLTKPLKANLRISSA